MLDEHEPSASRRGRPFEPIDDARCTRVPSCWISDAALVRAARDAVLVERSREASHIWPGPSRG